MALRLFDFGSPAAALRRAVRLSEEGKAAEAFPLLARAAKAGNAEAEYRVARCYLEGSGVPASRAEGARWLERAAGRGHIEAQTLLAALCVNGLADLRPAGEGQADRLFVAEQQAGPDFESALTMVAQGRGSRVRPGPGDAGLCPDERSRGDARSRGRPWLV